MESEETTQFILYNTANVPRWNLRLNINHLIKNFVILFASKHTEHKRGQYLHQAQ